MAASMAKLPGLLKRGGVYHLRVMVPLDLRDAREGRTKIIKTLDTADRQEASLRGVHLRAQWLARFQTLRKHPGDPLAQPEASAPLTPAPIATIEPPAKTLRHVFNQWKAVGDRQRMATGHVSGP